MSVSAGPPRTCPNLVYLVSRVISLHRRRVFKLHDIVTMRPSLLNQRLLSVPSPLGSVRANWAFPPSYYYSLPVKQFYSSLPDLRHFLIVRMPTEVICNMLTGTKKHLMVSRCNLALHVVFLSKSFVTCWLNALAVSTLRKSKEI